VPVVPADTEVVVRVPAPAAETHKTHRIPIQQEQPTHIFRKTCSVEVEWEPLAAEASVVPATDWDPAEEVAADTEVVRVPATD